MRSRKEPIPKPPGSIGAYASSQALKRSSPANAPYPGSAITVSPTGTRPVIASILRAASNAWAPTAQRNAHATGTQTVHPPASYTNKRPHG
ncbi:hypothetical protein EVAR_98656_1 [Eumeta japonica]|uniref:Uncharacterized protein n=1 Tax=Eumeta variegata TaxID=151549 RepID=A0A4C1XYH2_EUMVA|nr:hypothetical protein EVAR_98656_1 [Eumeta japonica]